MIDSSHVEAFQMVVPHAWNQTASNLPTRSVCLQCQRIQDGMVLVIEILLEPRGEKTPGARHILVASTFANQDKGHR